MRPRPVRRAGDPGGTYCPGSTRGPRNSAPQGPSHRKEPPLAPPGPAVRLLRPGGVPCWEAHRVDTWTSTVVEAQCPQPLASHPDLPHLQIPSASGPPSLASAEDRASAHEGLEALALT